MRRKTRLRESRDELQRIVHQLREPILIHQNGIIIYANPPAMEFCGTSQPEQIIGAHVGSFLSPDYAQGSRFQVDGTGENPNTTATEHQFKTISGKTLNVEIVEVPILFRGKLATQMMIRDITERKLEQQKLTEVVELFRLIEENMSDALCVMDHAGRTYYSSPSHRNLLGRDGYAVEDGMLISKNVHPDDLESVKRAFNHDVPFQTEMRVKHANGHYITVELNGVPIKGHRENGASLVLVLRDITNRKMTEEALHRSDKLTAVGELAAGIAHEIRNPLTSLNGFLQLMLPEASGIQRRYFDVMYSEITRIESITNELLVLAKPQSYKRVVADVNAMIDDVITLLTPRSILDNILIEKQNRATNTHCECIPHQLKQVFVNVTKNAMEAMRDGGKLNILIETSDGRLQISFEDDGVGIPHDRLPHISMPFYTTKEGGTGLGLLVSSRIIDSHGGSLEIQSEVNHGTTVTVLLPSARP